MLVQIYFSEAVWIPRAQQGQLEDPEEKGYFDGVVEGNKL